MHTKCTISLLLNHFITYMYIHTCMPFAFVHHLNWQAFYPCTYIYLPQLVAAVICAHVCNSPYAKSSSSVLYVCLYVCHPGCKIFWIWKWSVKMKVEFKEIYPKQSTLTPTNWAKTHRDIMPLYPTTNTFPSTSHTCWQSKLCVESIRSYWLFQQLRPSACGIYKPMSHSTKVCWLLLGCSAGGRSFRSFCWFLSGCSPCGRSLWTPPSSRYSIFRFRNPLPPSPKLTPMYIHPELKLAHVRLTKNFLKFIEVPPIFCKPFANQNCKQW